MCTPRRSPIRLRTRPLIKRGKASGRHTHVRPAVAVVAEGVTEVSVRSTRGARAHPHYTRLPTHSAKASARHTNGILVCATTLHKPRTCVHSHTTQTEYLRAQPHYTLHTPTTHTLHHITIQPYPHYYTQSPHHPPGTQTGTVESRTPTSRCPARSRAGAGTERPPAPPPWHGSPVI